MTAVISAVILMALRLYGLISAIGGVLILRNARETRRAQGDTDALRWILTGGALTFVTGIFLASGSRWAAVPAVLPAAQQVALHARQDRILPPGAAPRGPVHMRIALVVAAATLVAVRKGLLV